VEVRFGGIKFTKRSGTILIAGVAIALGSKFILGVSLWLSILLSLASVLITMLLVVVSRWPKYHSFLDSIGQSISSNEFHKHEPVVSLVPFRNYSMSCFARIEGDFLLFGKSKHWRSIHLEEIESVSLFEYAGFEVANLATINTQGEKVSFCIPWSQSIEEKVEFFESI
jgi:hypothetical protein